MGNIEKKIEQQKHYVRKLKLKYFHTEWTASQQKYTNSWHNIVCTTKIEIQALMAFVPLHKKFSRTWSWCFMPMGLIKSSLALCAWWHHLVPTSFSFGVSSASNGNSSNHVSSINFEFFFIIKTFQICYEDAEHQKLKKKLENWIFQHLLLVSDPCKSLFFT